MSDTNNIIEITGLLKSYGKVEAVRGLDFYVEKGKMFAFIGPNGAGKSTTIDMICTFLKPDAGRVVIDGFELGKDDNEIRNIIGAVFQDGLLDKLLTIEENLKVRGGLYGLAGKKLDDVVKKTAEMTGITNLMNRPYGKLSGGQRRRCDIARALINTPKILFLDEPTTGLDPQTRKVVWETISKIQKQTDMTIFLTTHYMEEAAKADFVIVIDQGKISAKGTPAQLKEQYSKDRVLLSTKQPVELAEKLDSMGLKYKLIADTYYITIEKTLDSLSILNECKSLIESLEVVKGTMDDAFITITGKELRE